MTDNSIYWYDYETFGSNPRRCRATQFAGQRTDRNLQPIGEPLVLYCKPAADFLPDPMACLTTGITPQQALAEGVGEAAFISRIRAEFSRPGTCVAGYNTIRFDDELTRQLLYRNFFDPYEHEWRNGNSRWDVIDMMRLCAAARPDGVHWPQTEAGTTTFQLSELSRANGLAQKHAHDALCDVQATIALARLVRERQPRLYDYVYQLRRKERVAAQINLREHNPILHVSRRYPAQQGCLALVIPVGAHPVNKNGVIAYDLRVDPRQWAGLSQEQLATRLFTPADKCEGARLPLKVIGSNRCPIVSAPTVLPPARAAVFGIDYDVCRAHRDHLLGKPDLMRRFCALYQSHGDGIPESDPDFMIYSGGFFGGEDHASMATLRRMAPGDLGRADVRFQDPRLPEMLFRYRARNYPETLSEEEGVRWRSFCRARLHDKAAVTDFERSLLQVRTSDHPERERILAALADYVAGIRAAVA